MKEERRLISVGSGFETKSTRSSQSLKLLNWGFRNTETFKISKSNETIFNVKSWLAKEKFIKGKDGAVYYNLTISVNDDTRYGNNVALMDSQTKEERDAKVQRNYLGNGKVVWTNDIIKLAEREQENTTAPVSNDLPF